GSKKKTASSLLAESLAWDSFCRSSGSQVQAASHIFGRGTVTRYRHQSHWFLCKDGVFSSASEVKMFTNTSSSVQPLEVASKEKKMLQRAEFCGSVMSVGF
ncbi:hypothetical protein AMECASPLE_020720, partial [Ameca splendens]